VASEYTTGAHGSVQIRFKNGIPVRFREFERRLAFGPPGGIHEDFDASELGACDAQKFFQACVVVHVAGFDKGTPSDSFNSGSGRTHLLGATSRRNNIGAGLGKSFSDGKANAAAAANHDGGFVRQIQKWVRHSFLSCSCVSTRGLEETVL
jgi:hypothetical protein